MGCWLPLFSEYFALLSDHEDIRNSNAVYCSITRDEFVRTHGGEGTAVAQWLRCCARNRKVAGSILAGVIGIFH